MNIPNFENTGIIGAGGSWSDSWSLIMQQLILELQKGAGPEGFEIPNLNAVDIAIIESTFVAESSDGVQPGTLVFDTEELNGGAPGSPNGQLKVLLNDGTFHLVTNT